MTDIRKSGVEMCDALSTLLHNSVREEKLNGYDPIDEEVEEPTIHDLIEEHGFEPLGIGSGRVVYRIPDVYVDGDESLVVKFARPQMGGEWNEAPEGIPQNSEEAAVWSRVQGTDKEHLFAPVVYAADHDRYVVMPEYDVEAASGLDANDIEFELKDSEFEPEIEREAVGLQDDDLSVLIDYGLALHNANKHD